MGEISKAKLAQGLVNKTAPTGAEFIIWDTELKGFGLKVAASGRKTYVLFYRTAEGTQRKPTIGDAAKLTTDEARRKAREWLAEATLGADPSGERQADRKGESIADLAERYFTDYAEHHKKPASVITDRSNMRNHVIPFMGSMKVKAVKRADIERLKLAVANGETAIGAEVRAKGKAVSGGTGMANRVVALVSKMFSCAQAWGLREDNPARGVVKFKEQKRERFLGDDEVRAVAESLAAAEREGRLSPYSIAAIRFLMLTGLRRSEVTNLRWCEVDLSAGCLRLGDTKTGGRTVPLSGPAMEIIAAFEPERPEDRVFRSSAGDAALALTRIWYEIRDAAGLGPDVKLHSLRHTFGSWSVMGGLSLAETGALLGHKSAQTTLRYAHHNQDAIRRNADRVAGTIAAMGKGEKAEVAAFRKR
ncbi:MAG: tyrosine-type recombinase/integrase [Rhodospirillaceae bacterium]